MARHRRKDPDPPAHRHIWQSDGYDPSMDKVHWSCTGCPAKQWLPIGVMPS